MNDNRIFYGVGILILFAVAAALLYFAGWF
jgi:hypothetical protein